MNLHKLVKNINDTRFSETEMEYLRKTLNLGFEVIYKKQFSYLDYLKEKVTETHYIMYHPSYFILLNWDTFCGDRNAANMYFNLSYNNTEKIPIRCSGHWEVNLDENYQEVKLPFERPNYFTVGKELEIYQEKVKQFRKENNLKCIWVGDKDAREGIQHFMMDCIIKGGEFIPWKYSPFLWLLNHGDTKIEGFDFQKINKEIFTQFPDWVKKDISLN